MNWKFLLPLPLAAFAVATPLRVPRLQPAIPLTAKGGSCDYSRALRDYLFAYAYSAENKVLAMRILASAENELGKCGAGAGILTARATGLRRALSREADNFRRPLP